jgi:hypothetical protein
MTKDNGDVEEMIDWYLIPNIKNVSQLRDYLNEILQIYIKIFNSYIILSHS